MRKIILASIFFLTLITACNDDDKIKQSENNDGFDRKGILTNWVTNIIKPSYQDFSKKLTRLKSIETKFVKNPTESELVAFQIALLEAQKAWQHVAMFQFGKAEELNYRAYMNTYPVDFETFENERNSEEDDTNITDNLRGIFKEKLLDKNGNFVKYKEKELAIKDINFSSIERADEQGFPVLDYMLNGLASSNADIVSFYKKDSNYKEYITKVVDRMVQLTESVTLYWDTNSTSVISKYGSNKGASFDKLINDYLNYFEQGFREAKIATPSGKRDGVIFLKTVESYYSPQNSKILFMEAYKAVKNFYYGNSYSDNAKNGLSIDDYLKGVNATVWDGSKREERSVTESVDEMYATIDSIVASLNKNFVTQITTDNTKMLNTFNVLQNYVVLTKTNIFQSLNVKVDFVDGDGD